VQQGAVLVERGFAHDAELCWEQAASDFKQGALVDSRVEAHLPAGLSFELPEHVCIAALGNCWEMEA
jgi:hypothetical protein